MRGGQDVTPAKAGLYAERVRASIGSAWMSAFAGMAGIALALSAASPAPAQSDPAQGEPKPLVLPTGRIPSEIFGIACRQRDGDSRSDASLTCFPPNPIQQPSISVIAGEARQPMSRSELSNMMREPFHERTLKVVREESFTPGSDPHAVGIRAVYQTDLGNRYVWALLSNGRLTQVIAAVFAPADFKAMTADIELKVYGVPEKSGRKARTRK